MPSPFPGMDPYMEDPETWPSVHTSLAVVIRDELVPLLRPNYFVTIELREYELSLEEAGLFGIGDVSVTRPKEPAYGPDGPSLPAGANGGAGGAESAQARPGVLTVQVPRLVPVRERYLEIRRPRTHELITVIEILSPTNKRAGRGRQRYERKRRAVVETTTNLVEIDLVRDGQPLPVWHRGATLPSEAAGDYRVLVSRGAQDHRADLYVISLREPLPRIPIPLRPGEAEPEIDLQAILTTVYDRGGYDLGLDYRAAPVPPLAPEAAAWADRLLHARGLR